VAACIRVQHQATERMARMEERQADSIASIRQGIYGPNYFHRKGISQEDDRRLEQFDPAGSKGSITISYVGGIGGADNHFQIQADGSILAIDHGVSRKVWTLDQGRCSDFFKRVITSGLLNCSDEVIGIKRDLAHPDSMTSRFDAPSTEFRIFVPELDTDKRIALDAQIELRNFPDIIEYQLVAALEKEILSFVPKDDRIWSPPQKK
jgi:hypothetical protein